MRATRIKRKNVDLLNCKIVNINMLKFLGIIPARYASTRFLQNRWLCWEVKL